MHQKRWGDARERSRVLTFNFGLGTIFSLFVVYFIFLYSRDKGWMILAFLSKWYIIIIGGLIALSLAIIVLVILFSLLVLLLAAIKLRSVNKHYKKEKSKDYVDVEYKLKD